MVVDKTESLDQLAEEFGLYSVVESGMISSLPPPLISNKELLIVIDLDLVSLVSSEVMRKKKKTHLLNSTFLPGP